MDVLHTSFPIGPVATRIRIFRCKGVDVKKSKIWAIGLSRPDGWWVALASILPVHKRLAMVLELVTTVAS